MNKLSPPAAALLTLGLLVACGQSPTGPEARPGAKANVTINLHGAFGALGLRSLQPLGTPVGATGAHIRVYDGAILAAQADLTGQSPSTTLTLEDGRTYRFEASITARVGGTKEELSWASASQTVAGPTTVTLRPRAVLKDDGHVHLQAGALGSDGTLDVRLAVTSAAGAYDNSFPESDYRVTYDVTGARKLGESVRGALLEGPYNESVSVTARVTALAADHTERTFSKTLTFAPAPADPLALRGQSQNWPQGYALDLDVASPDQAYGASGTVNTAGSFDVALPDARASLRPSAWANGSFRGAPVTWTVTPPAFNTVELTQFRLSHYDSETQGVSGYGTLSLGSRASDRPHDLRAGDRLSVGLVYADRSVTARGTRNPDPYTAFDLDLNLRPGWNVLIARVNAYGAPASPEEPPRSDLSITSAPFDPAHLPYGLAWYGQVRGIADLGVTAAASTPAPREDESFSYTFTVHNDGPTRVDFAQVLITLPAGFEPAGAESDHPDDRVFLDQDAIWFPHSLAPGERHTLTVRGRAAGGTAGRSLVASAELFDLGPSTAGFNAANNTASVSVTPTASASPSSATLKVDTTPPYVSLSGPPSDSQGVQAGVPITLDVFATDDLEALEPSVGVSRVEVYSGVRLLGNAARDPSGDWALTWMPPHSGTYNLTALAYDDSGNVGRSAYILNAR